MCDNTPSFTVIESDDHFARFLWEIDISSIQYLGSLHDLGRREQSTNPLEVHSGKFSIDPCVSIEWKFTIVLSVSHSTIRIGSDHYFFEMDFGITLEGEHFDDKNFKVILCYNVLDPDYIMYTNNPIKVQSCSYPDSNSIHQELLLSPVFSNNSSIFFRNSLMIIEGHITLQDNSRQVIGNAELVNLRQLQQDWKDVLKDKSSVDVNLKVNGSVLQAHSLVLSARSPVFRKMFETDITENSGNIVNIEDVTKTTMEAFILFLYTGEIKDHSYCAVVDLYYAADKYEVKTLHHTCRDLLVSYLSVGTALNILQLSDRHSDSFLKDITTDFIIENFKKIFILNDWKYFVDSNPCSASRILNCITLKMLKI